MKTEDIKMFHHIVEAGGLVKASELLDLPKSNLSRRLKSLEQELGIDLFHRQHKTIVISENGRRFYQSSKTFIEQLESDVQAMSSEAFELSGHLRVQILNLPDIKILVDVIIQFMRLHPKVTVEIITSSTEFDLIENNIDIGFRIGHQLEDMNLIARKLVSVKLGFYASPEYLKQHGTPLVPSDLENHEFILFRRFDGKIEKYLQINDETIGISGRLTMNDCNQVIAACLDHQGISLVDPNIIKVEIEQEKLIEILPDYPKKEDHGWLIYPRRKTLSPAAGALINYILEHTEAMSNPGYLFHSHGYE